MSQSQVKCPVHKSSNGCSLFWEFSYNNTDYKLYCCEECDLVFYSPFPKINYETHTDSISALKNYVHLNSNIEGLIQNVLNYFPEEGYGSMIEVGCGFGFTLDFAKHILGMDVTGYEPSLYGEIGARELQVNIERTYLTKNALGQKVVDLVYLSEVLEHIEDPFPFIDILKESMSKNGVFILTTPNYKALKKDLNVPSELALLSPGAHTILYSQKSLEKTLKDAGFKYVSVISVNNSLLAVSSCQEKKWKIFHDKNSLIRNYFHNVLNRVTADSLVYTGVVYRLLRNYVDFGNYEEAHKLLKNYPFPVLPSVLEINKAQSADELNEIGPACSAMLAYYLGMMQLNYYSDYKIAASCFHTSYLLCKKKILFSPENAVLEFNTLWLANYHYALSLFYEGDYFQAIKQLKDIKYFSYATRDQLLPIPDNNLKDLSDNLFHQVIEKL